MRKNARCLTVGLNPAIQRTMTFSRLDRGGAGRGEERDIRAGGKCLDLCRVLVREEMDTVCLTVAGRENWDTFRRLSLRDNLPLEIVPVKGKMPTFTTMVERESGRMTEVLSESPQEITPEEESYFMDVFGEIMMEDFCAMIIAGDRQPGFSESLIPHMIRAGKEKGMIIFADCPGEDLRSSFISGEIRPDYVRMGEKEFLETFGGEKPLRRAAKKLSQRYGNCFIITEENGGILIADRGRILTLADGKSGEIRPFGWNDTLLAGLAQGILEGKALREAIKQGFDLIARYGQIVRSA